MFLFRFLRLSPSSPLQKDKQVTYEGPVLMPLHEYKVQKVIGRGSFGQVQTAIHRPSGAVVAIKEIVKPAEEKEEHVLEVRRCYDSYYS